VTALSITDGDTLDVVEQDGTIGTVRLIGINTPESNECFARDAAEVLAVLVPVGAQIGMTSDVSDVDQYDRLLRYLWVGGMSVNEEMVRRGAAISRRYQPDTAMADRLEAAQLEAKDSQLGLWAPEVCGPRVDASLSIIAVEYDPPGNENDNLNEEWVKIRNDGDNLVDLTGWTIKDESASNRYAFPILFALAPGESVTIHSGCGDDFGSFLYWCSVGAAVWNNDGDTVFLLDPNGNAHTTHSYAGSNPTQAPPTTVLGRGWITMKVQFLISAANSGAQEVVFGRTIFTLGSRHEAYRHANAEEIQYVVRGRGIVIDGDEEIPVVAGDVVHTLR
jgi:micrococcal nuclease